MNKTQPRNKTKQQKWRKKNNFKMKIGKDASARKKETKWDVKHTIAERI